MCIRKEKAAQWEGQGVVPVMEADPKSMGSQTSKFCCLQRKVTFCALWHIVEHFTCAVSPLPILQHALHTHTSLILPASYSMIRLFITHSAFITQANSVVQDFGV